MLSRSFVFKNNSIETPNIDMRWPKYDIINSLANDPISYKIFKNEKNILYPDQVVYLGKKIFCVENILEFNQAVISKPSFIVYKNVGVLVANSAKPDVEELLQGHAELLLRLNKNNQLNPLKNKDILDIANWESEKYRQSLIR